MTHPTPAALASRNELDSTLADAKGLVEALNQLLDHLLPEDDPDFDRIREPVFAVLDSLREKLAALEKLAEK